MEPQDGASPTNVRQSANEMDIFYLQEELRSKQNLLYGVSGGVTAAIVSAIVWALITYLTEYQITWMALGVGFFVGGTIRWLGRGINPVFGCIGAILSLLGCLMGNILTVLLVIAREESIPFLQLLEVVNFAVIVELVELTFEATDVVFYALAAFAGFKMSYSQLRPIETLAPQEAEDPHQPETPAV